MLERIFIEVLNMSLTAAVVIIAVLIARILLRKMPHIISYAMWAVVLFRLLCPVSFSMGLSILGVLQNDSSVGGRMEYIRQDVGFREDPQARPTVDAEDPPLADDEPQYGGDIRHTASRIWLLGVITLLIYSAFCTVRLFKRLRQARHVRDNIYRVPGGGTPFVCGIIRPRIYCPESVDIERSDYIILHEQTHIRRGDHIFRLLACLALCLHWFNPLVWIAFFISERDMEMSCDEAVLRKAGAAVKKDYSASLLALSTGQGGVGGAPLAFGEKEPEGRIKNILRYKKPAAILFITASVFCAILAVLLIANPRREESEQGTASQENVPQENVTQENAAQENMTQENMAQESLPEEGAEGESTEQDDSSGEDMPQDDSPEEDAPQEKARELTSDIVKDGNVPDGEYVVYPRSISRSLRGFDRWMSGDDASQSLIPALAFADDCTFLVNRSYYDVDYDEVDFDEFADLADGAFSWIIPPVRCVFEDGLIKEAALQSAYYDAGISYEPPGGNDDWYEHIGELTEKSSEEMLDEYYTLVRTEDEAIDPPVGRIEVYTGNIGDGDSGIVLVYDEEGQILTTISAHSSGAGWNNIYLGRASGKDFLMEVHIEDRDDFGSYDYQVYWLDGQGKPLQLAGSSFTFGNDIGYDDAMFAEWVKNMDDYLSHCRLLLSTQDGELRTGAESDADRYDYEALKR